MGIKNAITEEALAESINRRVKSRFPISREVRYRMLHEGRILKAGAGQTINIGSGGVAFAHEHSLAAGALIELSISWPVLLENGCPVRLVVFGRVLRSAEGTSACTLDRYEFRTQARSVAASAAGQPVAMRYVESQ